MRIRTGDPEMAREINRALILDLLRKHDAIPRAKIARLLDLSKATVSAVVSQLLEDEFAIELGEGDARKQGGRKPILLSLNSSTHFVIGIDIGYTNIIGGIGNLKGELLAKIYHPTARSHSIEHVLAQVESLVAELMNQVGIERKDILGIGLSVAGTVEKSDGMIIFSPDFNWKNVHITELLEQRIQLQTIADNCTRVMTLGEIWYGLARQIKNLFYVNVGYGIGSAFVINNRIYNNHSEFGHVFVTKKAVRCTCGKSGCLEAMSSGQAIERKANEAIGDRFPGWISAKMVADLAEQGDVTAQTILHEAGRYLGRSISLIANCFNPDKIIIGGGVALAKHLLLESVREEYEAKTMDVIKEHATLELSSLGTDAGVFGAIALALDSFVFKQEIVSSVQRV